MIPLAAENIEKDEEESAPAAPVKKSRGRK